MDEITEKRIENDVERLGNVSKRSAALIDSEIGDMAALNAEMEKLLPQWSSTLMVMPGAMVTYVMSVFAKLGAPAGYVVQLLETALDADRARVWPQPGAQEPTWLVAHENGCAECEHGGSVDLASQCVRLILFAYAEMRDVLAAEYPAEDEAAWQRRAVAVISFMVGAFSSIVMA